MPMEECYSTRALGLAKADYLMAHSRYLASLNAEQRAALEHKLLVRQGGKCFICDQPIDLMLHKGQLDIDHIDPLIEDGLDAENNLALTHSACNRSKGAANLQIARRLSEFERLQTEAQKSGKRGLQACPQNQTRSMV
jgi:5-methylcytosine-specific restriction endonuclease McrA